MDNAEFTSQITQFTMLDELATMSAKIEENVLMSQSINNTAMLALVGRDCTVAGDEVHVAEGEASGSKLNCREPGTATIEVKDADGQTVATYVRTVDVGLNDIGWDGLLANGDKADDGAYTIEVSQVDASNQPVTSSTTLMTGSVQGLRYENGIAVVTVHGEEFYVSDIYQVS
jgi:flagellar basal-body rod modification protein FlgD